MTTNWTVKSIRDSVNAGSATAESIVDEAIRRIEEKDGEIGAFLEVFADDARKAAREVDARIAVGEADLPLAGVPIALKDNMLVMGHIASAGSKMLADYRATYTATVVTRLQEAGAIIIGRTNMDEFAFGSSTESSAFHVTKNPHDTSKVPGGTSGGSAAAVAAGMIPAALGSDTGGSIRQPSSLCGVVGMKPTYGRVSRYGIIADGSSLDQVGPIATTVEDIAIVLSVIEGKDSHDATSVVLDDPASENVSSSLAGVRIGVPKEYFIDGMDEDVAARIHEAIDTLKSGGAEIVNMSLPLAPYALPAFYIIQPAEASSNLARFDGMRYGNRGEGAIEESYRSARGAGFGAESKRRIMLGTFILSAGYYDAFYKKAIAVRAAMKMEFDAALKNVDVIVGPVSPIVAWGIGEKMDDPVSMYLADVFTVSANILGIPGISVPCGTAHGLPVGLQVLGKSFDDNRVLQVAAAFEGLHNAS
ncbi:MAG: Asp-tRNA(Asn)/Glu-tRNA(Gln) amidotransferase subunit GatA [Patescibacteria group bacterium]